MAHHAGDLDDTSIIEGTVGYAGISYGSFEEIFERFDDFLIRTEQQSPNVIVISSRFDMNS